MTGSGEIRHPAAGWRITIRPTETHDPAHWRRGCWQLIAVWSALRALLAGATLAVKSDGKDRENRQAGRERER
jgi:hypothetical protein